MKALEYTLKASEAKVSAVLVKLPPFWPNKAKLVCPGQSPVFAQKYHCGQNKVCAHDHDAGQQHSRISHGYHRKPCIPGFKTRLTRAFALSDNERAKRLLEMNRLGDKTPSQSLSSMLSLVLDGQDPGFLFRKIFLPIEVRTHLVQSTKIGTNAASLRELASEADKYFASMGSKISSISEAPYNLEDPNVNAVSSRQVCSYHAKFGDKATKCQKLCSFKSTSRSSSTSKSTIEQGNFCHGRRFLN